jgi:hypothetical protein
VVGVYGKKGAQVSVNEGCNCCVCCICGFCLFKRSLGHMCCCVYVGSGRSHKCFEDVPRKALESMSTGRQTLARDRWILLQEAITKKRIPEPRDNPASKRVFEKYSEFISWKPISTNGEIQVEITLKGKENKRDNISNNNSLCIRHPTLLPQVSDNLLNSTLTPPSTNVFPITVFRDVQYSTLEINDLRGYDKTGRICIWPAEQALAYWCLSNLPRFEDKVVIELGGGFHCLAGLCIAKFGKGLYRC